MSCTANLGAIFTKQVTNIVVNPVMKLQFSASTVLCPEHAQ